MPKRILPRIAAVAPDRAHLVLRLRWQDGGESKVNVSGLVETFRVYAPLRENRALFRQVHVGEHRADVVWTDEIDMSADTLRRLAQEQSGETMTADAFRAWRLRKAYTLDGAARALGLSRRTVAYYESGEKRVPRLVALATRALESEAGRAA